MNVEALFNKLAAKLQPKRRPLHTGPHYADLYARAIAATIDFGIIYLLLNTPFRLLTSKLYAHVDTALLAEAQRQTQTGAMLDLLFQSGLPFWWAVNASIQIVAMGVLIVGTQCAWGTTPGKKIIGLRIVRYPSLEAPARWRFVVRFLSYILSAGCLMIGIFWTSFNRERRAWHDYIAGTAVLNERPGSWYWNKIKLLYYKIRGSAAVEQPVGEPPAE